ncbi:MAG: hypothetical protein KJ798_09560 [Gammaproteobacteria bacterium]|nr:hypothetical protein [Gammaproteobacteria bacterium]MBU0850609.1 hypothetical protein [Gammaproteobacteria bacterium]MBU1268403.1 hypothetical protein [Gammaproteobacteria bacterium]MBU1780621.1 hypothetical protein [Gammaproteobacteria bacterium]MBU2086093.1 hypothetical protein [Gammaproteobacteria bacterium]
MSAGSGKNRSAVDELLAQYVHKMNNSMLPFVLELDDHLERIAQCTPLEQMKLRAFEVEIEVQMQAIKRIRALLSKKSTNDTM